MQSNILIFVESGTCIWKKQMMLSTMQYSAWRSSILRVHEVNPSYLWPRNDQIAPCVPQIPHSTHHHSCKCSRISSWNWARELPRRTSERAFSHADMSLIAWTEAKAGLIKSHSRCGETNASRSTPRASLQRRRRFSRPRNLPMSLFTRVRGELRGRFVVCLLLPPLPAAVHKKLATSVSYL